MKRFIIIATLFLCSCSTRTTYHCDITITYTNGEKEVVRYSLPDVDVYSDGSHDQGLVYLSEGCVRGRNTIRCGVRKFTVSNEHFYDSDGNEVQVKKY
jgi:hypothetical protein